MKLKSTFITHNAGSEQHIIDASGRFSGLVTGNAAAAFIVEQLKTETTSDKIVDAMCEKYDAPRDVIAADTEEIIAKLRSIGAIDE